MYKDMIGDYRIDWRNSRHGPEQVLKMARWVQRWRLRSERLGYGPWGTRVGVLMSELTCAKGEGRALSMQHLMSALDVSRNTMVSILDKWEEAGDIVRRREGREVLVEMTPKREQVMIKNTDGFIDIIFECADSLRSAGAGASPKPTVLYADLLDNEHVIMVPTMKLTIPVYADHHLSDGVLVQVLPELAHGHGIGIYEGLVQRSGDRPEVMLKNDGDVAYTIHRGTPLATLV